MVLNREKNGIILRFPFIPKNKKTTSFKVKFSNFCMEKIKEGVTLGYNCFIFELSDEDFNTLDFSNCEELKDLKKVIDDNNIRIAIYIKSKKFLTSDVPSDAIIAIDELKKCLDFCYCISPVPQVSPVILHIGGAKGDRKTTMEIFCSVIEENFTSDEIKRIAVINDDKPSLFSVKDLLPGVFYRLKLPIIFRSTSYPTNQGNLTINESLFLAASTWERSINPIFFYLPNSSEAPDLSGKTAPFGLQLDIVFDNKLPDPE